MNAQQDTLEKFFTQFASAMESTPVTWSWLLSNLGQKGFQLALFFLGLLLIAPLPFFLTVLVCVPALLLSAQMAAGYGAITLNSAIGGRALNGVAITKYTRILLPYIHTLETLCKPRALHIFNHKNEQLIHYSCFGMVLGNLLPHYVVSPVFAALGLTITAFALLIRDGRLVIFGCAVGLSCIAFTAVALVLAGFFALV